MELRAPLRREAPGRAARPQHRCAGSGGRRRRRLPPGALTPEPPGPRSRLLPPPPPGSLLTFRKTPDVTGSPRVSPPPRRWRRRRRHPRLSREARRGRGGRQTARGEPDRGGRLRLRLIPAVNKHLEKAYTGASSLWLFPLPPALSERSGDSRAAALRGAELSRLGGAASGLRRPGMPGLVRSAAAAAAAEPGPATLSTA
ncbi:uncharacterized protein LOC143693590 [Agelaius phoeniceus]|uniref:uncharacterized protein LOC143693590 n=1 Tax=Agelaius phoeniceus TaxID=39638 RepID=UPI004054E318